jgi:hypothetical protein
MMVDFRRNHGYNHGFMMRGSLVKMQRASGKPPLPTTFDGITSWERLEESKEKDGERRRRES